MNQNVKFIQTKAIQIALILLIIAIVNLFIDQAYKNGFSSQSQDIMFFKSKIYKFKIITILFIYQMNHFEFYHQYKENKIKGNQFSSNQTTDIIFRGNFISMYKFPIQNQTVSIVKDENYENSVLSIQTGDQGQFELKYALQEKDFIGTSTTLALYINISNQLIKKFPYKLSQDFLHSSSIVFEFLNKVLEQSSKVNSYVNGSVEDKSTLKSLSQVKVEIMYYYPMMMARKEIITNKVGYFEFHTVLDYFQIIIADIIVSKEGYITYKASEDQQFKNEKGIALYDDYKYTFIQSIKLEKQQSP